MTALSGTKWAVLIGVSVGGLSGVLTWQRPALEAPSMASAPPPLATAAPAPPRETTTLSAALPRPAARVTAAASSTAAARSPLLDSPHERVLGSAREVERAEVRCIEEKDGDACMHAADAFAAGKVVAADTKRVKRYASIARTHYVAQCQDQSSLACQRLSLLYRSGDGVRQSVWTADQLLARAKEHCHLRRNQEFCAALGAPPR